MCMNKILPTDDARGGSPVCSAVRLLSPLHRDVHAKNRQQKNRSEVVVSADVKYLHGRANHPLYTSSEALLVKVPICQKIC